MPAITQPTPFILFVHIILSRSVSISLLLKPSPVNGLLFPPLVCFLDTTVNVGS